MADESKRNRKANFTVAECSLILEQAEKDLDVIKSKFSSVITNKRKNRVWEEIAKVNSLGVCIRSVSEVKDKWRAMVSNTRKEHAKVNKDQRKTGGGEKTTSPKITTRKIIDLFGEDPSFSGIRGGFDSASKYLLGSKKVIHEASHHNSQEILDPKAISLRLQGKGKRPNKAQPLAPEEESVLWGKGQIGDFNARVLTNINYDSYVEDIIIRQEEDGSEVVEFHEGPTKTQSGGLRIRRRTTPQVMYSTDDGERDPVRLFKLWLSKRPEGMKDNGPLYLCIINRPKSTDVWYTKIRMGQNAIGTILKSMASCLMTNKKLINHSMRKTLVSKLKKFGQPRHVICEITGHARESSLDDYDEIDENQRNICLTSLVDTKEIHTKKSPTKSVQMKTQAIVRRAPLVSIDTSSSSISHLQQQSQMYRPMGFNPGFQHVGFPGFQPNFDSQYRMPRAFSTLAFISLFQRKITWVAPSITSQKMPNLLNHRRNEGLTLLSRTTRIELCS
ncbi:hypothetical protein QZH41_001284 [Actinostola sp. cb2023]|nr:hypothetical protein QZH41_001284 [Actinostola sp. cb2023]